MSTKIDDETILKLAYAAKLEVADARKFSQQVKKILEAFSEIDSADTEGVEPSFHPIKLEPTLREDTPTKSLTQEQALENHKDKKDGYFKGPKVV